ncbi:replicative DNA helicase [Pontibacter sp. 172403-2]|uniref:replicative DNA helicase n=1 Tax=Pontibacter rufus TaxID=2791028 RepID=UPI0018AFE23A|nr:replicative DNA helicase [Pontibacter sp. 172403-2]MBF9252462.1 replicative DNA helicase [Pontibacter sp. 172403-2]
MSHNAKTMPHSKELERLVLGAVLTDRNTMNTCIELIPDLDFFYDIRHQQIYQSLLNLRSKDFDIDLMTCTQQLRQEGHLETVGGAIYIAELASLVNSGLHIESHIRKLQEAYIKRRIIVSADTLLQQAFDPGTDALENLADTQVEIMRLAEILDKKGEHSMYQVVDTTLKDLVAKSKGQELTGIPSAIRAINTITAGYQPTDLIIVAARPSMGKTAFALNEVRVAAIQYQVPVAFFSLEMSYVQLGKRLISSETRIDSNTLKKPSTLSDFQWQKLATDTAKLSGAPIYVDDTAGLTIMQLRAKAARMVAKYGIKLIVVDYLQLIKNPAYKNREQEISSITRELKLMAKDLHVPVIALAQLSRAVEARGDKTPQLSDLRESGAIEQDADIITFLMRPEYYGMTEDEDGYPTAGLTKFIIAKHRNGDLGEIWLEHDLPHNLYGDIGTLSRETSMPVSQFEQEPTHNFYEKDDDMPF